jgi:hypothetical protein
MSNVQIGAVSCVDKFGRPVAIRVNLARCHRTWQFNPTMGRYELRELEREALAVCRGQL